jgi:isopenicillin N synthase-like dioxygenase
MTLPSVPTVSLDDIRSSDPARRARAAEALKVGFGTFGLVYVSDHGLTPAEQDRFYDSFHRLTKKPESEKQKWARADLWYQRGWTPPNTEKAVAAEGQPDFKECWFNAPMAYDEAATKVHPELYAPNVWPEGDDEFREVYTKMGKLLHLVGETLLVGVAQAYGLGEQSLVDLVQGAPHVFRALRYLPLNEAQATARILWGEEHTDFNLLTILPGGRFLDLQEKPCAKPDDASGLFLRTRPSAEHPNGQLVPGVAPPGCMVAQVGQQLEILTGGTLIATPHVITAPKVPGYSRLSSAHFVHLHTDVVLQPIAPFRTPETIAAYRPPVLTSTYDLKTLVDIGLAPREALDALGYRNYDRLASAHAVERKA